MFKVYNKFPARLREVREENNLKQKELGELLGYSQVCIAKWESGDREPKLDDLIRLCNILKVSAGYLLGLED